MGEEIIPGLLTEPGVHRQEVARRPSGSWPSGQWRHRHTPTARVLRRRLEQGWKG